MAAVMVKMIPAAAEGPISSGYSPGTKTVARI